MTRPLNPSHGKTTNKDRSTTDTKRASTTKNSDLKKGQPGLKNPSMHSTGHGFNKSK